MAYIPAELRRQVESDPGGRCGYCHTPEVPIGSPLEVHHLLPEADDGPTTRENLWLACSRCNGFKGDRTRATDPNTGESIRLFNPREQRWNEHFAWDINGCIIVGLTAAGRATVIALRLNNRYIVDSREFWVTVGRWPPIEDRNLLRDF